MDEKMKLYGDGMHDDTDAIQTMLDKCGTVRIPDGCYLISKPLIIHSYTHLILSSLATLRLANGANCSILDNDGLYSDETNVNITIEGGIWDGNHMMQERQKIPNEGHPGDENEDQICDKQIYISNIYVVFMVRLVHTEHLQVKNLTFKDPTSYAIHIADSRYFNVENITLDYDLLKPNMDGVHIQGPARFGKIRNIFGNIQIVQFDILSGELPEYLSVPTKIEIPNAYELIESFFTPIENHISCHPFYYMSCLYRLLWEMDEHCARLAKKYKKLQPALTEIIEFRNENKKVSYYAELCNISEPYFRKLFCEYTGMSTIDYRNDLRLTDAKNKLQSGEYNVSEAAYESGFTNLSFFIRLYKKKYGHTPKNEG